MSSARRAIKRLLSRVRGLLRRGAADERMDEEIRFHIEMETERNVGKGMSPAAARRQARLAFGGTNTPRETMRESRKIPLVENLWRDLRLGARSHIRAPGLAAVAILTLAIGIGATTAMFSVLNAVLLRDLPVESEDELVVLWAAAQGTATDHLPLYQEDLIRYRESTQALTSVAGVAYQGAIEVALRRGDSDVMATGSWVTGDLMETLGVEPILGRALLPSDDVAGAEPVMVIGEGVWRRVYGGDPAVLGESLQWNATTYRIVGVIPAGFDFPAGAEFWVPVYAAFPDEAPLATSGYVIWDAVGRLRPGATIADVSRELGELLRETEAAAAMGTLTPVVTPYTELVTGEVRGTLTIAGVAVLLLLLTACINVGNLLLIRGSSRGAEFGIRRSLGASGPRLVLQVLAEAALLAGAAGAVGVLLTYGGVAALLALAPEGVPRIESVRVDRGVLLFALAVTALVALLAGLVPALVSASRHTGGWLRARTIGSTRHASLLRRTLVGGQVALAVLVLAGAGLLVRSLALLQGADMGFRAEQLTAIRTTPPPTAGPEKAQQLAALDEMTRSVGAIPGVQSVAWMPSRPFSGEGGWSGPFTAEGQSQEEQELNPLLNLESIGPGYFETFILPVLRGRAFTSSDGEAGALVAIVSQAVADHAWPGEDPIGKRIKIGGLDAPDQWRTVVGVAADSRYRDLVEPQPSLYLPTAQFGPMPGTIAVRSSLPPGDIVRQVRAALAEIHPEWRVIDGGSIRQLSSAPLARPRFSGFLMSAFGLVTLILCLVGIYSAMAATVRERSREIGLRLAIGANSGNVRKMVLQEGMLLAGAGLMIGLVGAFAGTRLLRSLLFGVAPTDPITFGAVVIIIALTGLGACYLPAARAARLDPAAILRAE